MKASFSLSLMAVTIAVLGGCRGHQAPTGAETLSSSPAASENDPFDQRPQLLSCKTEYGATPQLIQLAHFDPSGEKKLGDAQVMFRMDFKPGDHARGYCVASAFEGDGNDFRLFCEGKATRSGKSEIKIYFDQAYNNLREVPAESDVTVMVPGALGRWKTFSARCFRKFEMDAIE